MKLTEEGNKLIRLFEIEGTVSKEEYEMRSIKHLRHFEDLQYHTSWDALMPVVEKIEENNTVEIKYHTVVIGYANVFTKADTKIEAVWLAVVEFIKWYNQNKKGE